MPPESEKDARNPKEKVPFLKAILRRLREAKAFLIVALVAGALLIAFLLLIWPWGLTAREKTAEQWLREGLAFFRQQRYFLADRAFREALRLDPHHGDAAYYLGQLYDSCWRRREALEWYTRAVETEPALSAAAFNRGLLYGLEGSTEMELASQKQAVETNPAFAAAWFRLGEIYFQRRQWADAAEAYQKAAANPNALVDRELIATRLAAASEHLARKKLAPEEKFTLPPQEPPPTDRLCTRCHTDAERQHKLKGDTTNGCLRCHAPHNPLMPPLLKRPAMNQCQVCHFEYSEDAIKFARKEGFTVHMPLVNGHCTDCHREHKLGEKSELRTSQRFLCFSCHPDFKGELNRHFQHPPYKNGYCTDCHNPHLSKELALLQGPQNKLCYLCHFVRTNIKELPVQHSPFKNGFCTSCHEPHSSNYRGLLRLQQLRLCYSCHFDREADLAKPYKHKPYAEGKCCDCHDPHAALTKGLLPARSQTEFCLKCHSREYVFGPNHHPVPDSLRCTACHHPHAGYARALLPKKSPDLCFDCHNFGWGKMGLVYFKRSKHGKLACTDCHGGIGLGFRFRTREEALRACLRCHPDYIGKTAKRGKKTCYLHPVGPPWQDWHNGGLLTCSSTCHNPHGTPYRCLLTAYGDGLCLKCHKEKARAR